MAAKKQTPPLTADATAEAPSTALLVYEIIVSELRVSGVIAYQTARVNLTKAQAEAINDAQPGSLKFIGI